MFDHFLKDCQADKWLFLLIFFNVLFVYLFGFEKKKKITLAESPLSWFMLIDYTFKNETKLFFTIIFWEIMLRENQNKYLQLKINLTLNKIEREQEGSFLLN